MKIRNPKTILWVVKIGLTLAFAYFVNRSLRGGELLGIVQAVTPAGLTLALVMIVAALACQIRRWEIILRLQGFGVRGAVVVQTVLFGYCLAFVTPGRLGELFRGLTLDSRRKGDAVFAAVIDKVYSLAATVVLGAVCALIQLGHGVPLHHHFAIILPAVLALSVVGALTVIAGRRFWPAATRPLRGTLRRCIEGCPRLFSRGGAAAMGYSLAAQLFLLIQTALLMVMFGSNDLLANFLAAGQAYMYMLFFPFFVANVGIREYSFNLFLSQSALAPALSINSVALGASLCILVVNLIMPALVGLIWTLLVRAGDGPGRGK